MDEALEFCVRVLGPGQEAIAAARAAGSRLIPVPGATAGRRLKRLAAASRACREAVGSAPTGRMPPAAAAELAWDADGGLAGAVARELAVASAALPERQREALALREALDLSHGQIAEVMAVAEEAVAPLLAHARLRLRAERRGELPPAPDCSERDRALRLLACRQDAEPVSADDDEWLTDHLLGCEACDHAYAAMLEASVCYRAWSLDGATLALPALAPPVPAPPPPEVAPPPAVLAPPPPVPAPPPPEVAPPPAVLAPPPAVLAPPPPVPAPPQPEVAPPPAVLAPPAELPAEPPAEPLAPVMQPPSIVLPDPTPPAPIPEPSPPPRPPDPAPPPQPPDPGPLPHPGPAPEPTPPPEPVPPQIAADPDPVAGERAPWYSRLRSALAEDARR